MMSNVGRFQPVVVLIGLIWLIHIANVLLGGLLYAFGLEPRQLAGLDGLIGAPLLHSDLQHLMSNTAGLAILGSLVCIHGSSTFWRVSAFVAIVAGAATWVLARQGLHVGASGLVFGYFGYLVARGIVERTPVALGIALVVAVTYSGLLYGVLPNQTGISWEGHLFGFLAGLLAARWRIHLDTALK